ncbi:MAG: hypothetical protein AAGI48_02175 [Verrucomicrobiota bacterium]
MSSTNRRGTSALAFVIFIAISSGCLLHASDSLPEEIAGDYANTPQASVSDEFDGDTLNRKKWAYRMIPKGSKEWGEGDKYVSMERDGDTGYVAIRGNWDERKGSGLAGMNVAQFGFYSTRWRTVGIELGKITPWHPAIWMAWENTAGGDEYRRIPMTPRRLEIDLMEYWHQPVWQIQSVGWGKGNLGMQKMRLAAPDFPTEKTGWKTVGVEYTPTYLQAWEIKEGKWHQVGKSIPFVEGETSPTQLNKGHVQPGYWILSNKLHWSAVEKVYDGTPDLSKCLLEDSSLDVDFFRFYPLVVEE